jgi:hypothetical protein
MRSLLALVLAGSLAGLAGCGGGDDSGDDDVPVDGDGSPIDVDADPSAPDAADPAGWDVLLTGDWELAAGTEGYQCAYVTLEEDVWFDGVEAIAPLGTHHTVLSVGNPSRADGVYSCNAGTNYNTMLYASGLGTDRFTFPSGVGMHVEAGQQLLLNLHLFNFSETPLTGTSGNRVHVVQQSDIEFEAESILAGAFPTLNVPPGESTQQGHCTMNGDTNIFAVIPHMHMLGTHMKIVAESTEIGDVTIHDAPYSFDEQYVTEMEPVIPMKSGDRLEVFCTYNNTTGATVNWGDSSLEEMCFSITFRYPATGNLFGIICSN